jgi:tRNA A37 threonylcarbamoyltransferase TsaD
MVTCLVIAGGVAANKAVRAGLDAVALEAAVPCTYPSLKFCTDNGLMVAWTGVERLRLGLARKPPADVESVKANVEVLPRWPIGPMDPRSAVKKGAGTCKMFH